MAAGEGFKTWNTGDVLSANDVNGYLMQGIWVFDDAADRTAQVTAPAEGNFSYLKDTNKLYYYTGSAWAEADTSGILPSEFTAKGDLLAGTGNATFDNLAVGANGTILTADSSTATGLKWAAPAGGGGLTLITRTTFSNVSSQAFDSVFSTTYLTYLVVINDLYAATAADDLHFQFRYGTNTQSASYYGSLFTLDTNAASHTVASSNTAQVTISRNAGSSSRPLTATIYVNNVGFSADPTIHGRYIDSAGEQGIFGVQMPVTRTYDGFLLKSSSSNITGSVSIFGLAK